MSFGENLQFLRKRNGITQEQLAEQLKVSRQSVSKWESDGSFPEMDKLMQMCNMFSCDLDTLIRKSAEESTAEDTAHYDTHMNNRSRWIAGGVGLIIIGLGMQTLLDISERMEILGTFLFLCCVAGAVTIFIIKEMQHESFRRRNPQIRFFYSENEIYRFEKKYPLLMAVPVAVIILNIACFTLIDEIMVKPYAENLSTSVFMWIQAIAIAVLVYGGMQKAKYNIKAYNKESIQKKSNIAKYCGIVMLIATALFVLSIGITAMNFMQAKAAGLDFSWKSSIMAFSWVVFPIGGIICAIVSAIVPKEDSHIEAKEETKSIQGET